MQVSIQLRLFCTDWIFAFSYLLFIGEIWLQIWAGGWHAENSQCSSIESIMCGRHTAKRNTQIFMPSLPQLPIATYSSHIRPPEHYINQHSCEAPSINMTEPTLCSIYETFLYSVWRWIGARHTILHTACQTWIYDKRQIQFAKYTDKESWFVTPSNTNKARSSSNTHQTHDQFPQSAAIILIKIHCSKLPQQLALAQNKRKRQQEKAEWNSMKEE